MFMFRSWTIWTCWKSESVAAVSSQREWLGYCPLSNTDLLALRRRFFLYTMRQGTCNEDKRVSFNKNIIFCSYINFFNCQIYLSSAEESSCICFCLSNLILGNLGVSCKNIVDGAHALQQHCMLICRIASILKRLNCTHFQIAYLRF